MRLAIASLAVALAAAGCGSTVQSHDAAGAAGGGLSVAAGGQGESVPQDQGAANGPAVTTGVGPTRSGLTQTPLAGRQGADATASEAARAPASAASGPGYTATTVLIGVPTQKVEPPLADAIGFDADFGDPEAQARALFADINRRGGLLGRRLVPVFHDIGVVESNADDATSQQAACAAFTEDRRVFAVLSNVAVVNGETFADCLAQRGVPLFFNDTSGRGRDFFARRPTTLFGLGTATFERSLPLLVARLTSRGFFGGWDARLGATMSGVRPRVGLYYGGRNADGAAFLATAKRELARIGLAPVTQFGYDGDLATAGRDAASAVFRFNDAGVTHVLADSGEVLFFMQNAEQQRYFPRYALSTFNSLILLSASAPAGQLRGAMGIGYLPFGDVDAAHKPGDTSAAARCRAVMSQAGEDPRAWTTEWVMQILCDGAELLVTGARSAGSLDVRAVAAAVDGLGRTVPSGLTFSANWAPRVRDGAGAARDLGYDAGCGCFRYADKVNRAF